MNYYKDNQGNVFAYSDIQTPAENLIELTPEEIEAHLNPPAEPAPVPQSVTRAQGKAALIQAGLWASVVSYVDAIEDPTEQALARVALDDTTEWRRDSPFLLQAADALGITGTEMDALFVAAAKIAL